MQKIILSNDQRVNLEALHASTRDGRIRDRIKAVLLRWSTPMIAQALRLHETSIVRHINDYLKKEKLKPTNGGSTGYLSRIQTEDVVQHLMSNTYQCSYQLIDYIYDTHEIRFSIYGLNKWLHLDFPDFARHF